MLVEGATGDTKISHRRHQRDKTWQLRLGQTKAKLEQLKSATYGLPELQLKQYYQPIPETVMPQSTVMAWAGGDVLKHEVAIAQIEMESPPTKGEPVCTRPSQGVVVGRYKQPGEYVSAGEGLIPASDTDAAGSHSAAGTDDSKRLLPSRG